MYKDIFTIYTSDSHANTGITSCGVYNVYKKERLYNARANDTYMPCSTMPGRVTLSWRFADKEERYLSLKVGYYPFPRNTQPSSQGWTVKSSARLSQDLQSAEPSSQGWTVKHNAETPNMRVVFCDISVPTTDTIKYLPYTVLY